MAMCSSFVIPLNATIFLVTTARIQFPRLLFPMVEPFRVYCYGKPGHTNPFIFKEKRLTGNHFFRGQPQKFQNSSFRNKRLFCLRTGLRVFLFFSSIMPPNPNLVPAWCKHTFFLVCQIFLRSSRSSFADVTKKIESMWTCFFFGFVWFPFIFLMKSCFSMIVSDWGGNNCDFSMGVNAKIYGQKKLMQRKHIVIICLACGKDTRKHTHPKPRRFG